MREIKLRKIGDSQQLFLPKIHGNFIWLTLIQIKTTLRY